MATVLVSSVVTKTEGHGLLKLDLLPVQTGFFVSMHFHVFNIFCLIKKREQPVSITPFPTQQGVLWSPPK